MPPMRQKYKTQQSPSEPGLQRVLPNPIPNFLGERGNPPKTRKEGKGQTIGPIMQPQESTTQRWDSTLHHLRYEDNKYREPKVCRGEFLRNLKQ